VEQRIDGSCEDDFTLIRSWTATDRCGNALSASQTIVVRDTVPPILVGVPADLTVECASLVPPPAPVTATDACAAPRIRLEEVITLRRCTNDFVLTRTWIATDRCDNESRESQVVTVRDVIPPAVVESLVDAHCLWPPNHRMGCFGTADFSPAITDNCGSFRWSFAGCPSNQPDDAPDPSAPGSNGDGSTTGDCAPDPAGDAFCVRAERDGGGTSQHDGRRYAITIVAVDDCGNRSDETVIGRVHVPHDGTAKGANCRPGRRD
jgi:hypothetical protein